MVLTTVCLHAVQPSDAAASSAVIAALKVSSIEMYCVSTIGWPVEAVDAHTAAILPLENNPDSLAKNGWIVVLR